MATDFPSSIDSYTNPSATDPLNSPSHSAQHTNVNDAVVAIEKFVQEQTRTAAGISLMFGDGVDGDIGPPGIGIAGAAGATGAQGPPGFGFDGSDGDEGPMGPPGQTITTSTRTARVWLNPAMWSVDDATLSNVGTTPDLADALLFSEATGRSGAYTNVQVPYDWNGGAITLYIVWSTNSSTGDVRWLLSVSNLAQGDSPGEVSDLLAASGTTIADSTTVKLTSLGSFTPVGTADTLKINLERNAGVAADTATGNARVHMAYLEYVATVPAGPTGATGAAGPPWPVQTYDEGTITVPTTGYMGQRTRWTLSGVERGTAAGTGRVDLFNPDDLNLIRRYSYGSFTLWGDEYVLQQQRLAANGDQRITMTEQSRVIITDFKPRGTLVLAGTGGGIS